MLLCPSHHLTQLSDRCQLALMMIVHISLSCGSCMFGIGSGVGRVDWHLTTELSGECEKVKREINPKKKSD